MWILGIMFITTLIAVSYITYKFVKRKADDNS